MSARKPTREDVIALEKSYWEAMKAKDGTKTAALSAPKTLVTGPQGTMTVDKAKMGAMTEEGAWELKSYKLADIEVSVPTPDVAIIVYKVVQTVKMNGKEQQMHAADSSTWIRGENGWECHAHAEALLTEAKAA